MFCVYVLVNVTSMSPDDSQMYVSTTSATSTSPASTPPNSGNSVPEFPCTKIEIIYWLMIMYFEELMHWL